METGWLRTDSNPATYLNKIKGRKGDKSSIQFEEGVDKLVGNESEIHIGWRQHLRALLLRAKRKARDVLLFKEL